VHEKETEIIAKRSEKAHSAIMTLLGQDAKAKVPGEQAFSAFMTLLGQKAKEKKKVQQLILYLLILSN
jgi:hypothetical protein